MPAACVASLRMSTTWSGKTVLVTGGSGFLGRVLVARLKAAGATVVAPRSAEHDLTQPGVADRLVADTRPEHIIHLAARVGGIGYNQVAPAPLYLDNLLMGTYMIEAARRSATVQKTTLVGTVCSYPKFTPVPFHEESLWDGYPEETNAPYGIAKKALLVQSQAYRQQYGFNSIFLLPSNLYGPADNFDPKSSHVIPALIRKCAEAVQQGRDAIEVWGDGTATREFLYVDDAAEAIVLACEQYDSSDPVNIGNGEEISIRHVVERVAAHVGFRGRIVWNTAMPNGQPRRRLDVSRAEQRFGFRAGTPFEEGLRRTVEWYLAAAAGNGAAANAAKVAAGSAAGQ